jgi:hypothetical protein
MAKTAYAHVDRIVSAIGAGSRLLVLDDLCLSAPWPQLPAGWTLVEGSESRTPHDHFVAYTQGDIIVTLRAVRGGGLDPAGRLIALMTLGTDRVSLFDAGPDRFDARWTRGDLDYRMTVGPAALGAFMKLLLSTGWH